MKLPIRLACFFTLALLLCASVASAQANPPRPAEPTKPTGASLEKVKEQFPALSDISTREIADLHKKYEGYVKSVTSENKEVTCRRIREMLKSDIARQQQISREDPDTLNGRGAWARDALRLLRRIEAYMKKLEAAS